MGSYFRMTGARGKVVFTRVANNSGAPGEGVIYLDADPASGVTWLTTAELKALYPQLATLTDAQVTALAAKSAFYIDNRAAITAVGQVQYSADGTTWVDAIPANTLKAGQPVNFYIKPKTVTAADPLNTYRYDFLMATVGSGGLSLINGTGSARNTARIFGTTPADQVGQTFSVNVTVTDDFGTTRTGTALTQAWS